MAISSTARGQNVVHRFDISRRKSFCKIPLTRVLLLCTITLVLAQPHYCKIEKPKSLGRLFHFSRGRSFDGKAIESKNSSDKAGEAIENSKFYGLNKIEVKQRSGKNREGNDEKYAKLREFKSKGVPLDTLTRRLRSHPSLESLSIVRWLEGILEKEIDKESQSLKQLLLGYKDRLSEEKKKDETNWLQRLVRGISGVKERGDGEVSLETSDGQITELGVAVLNAVLKSFLEKAYSLNNSVVEDKRSAVVGNTVNVPGYLVLSNEIKTEHSSVNEPHHMGLQDSSRVNMLPPVKITLNEKTSDVNPTGRMLHGPHPSMSEGKRTFSTDLNENAKETLRDPPRKSSIKSRYSKCSTRGPAKKMNRKLLIVENSFPPPILKDGKQRKPLATSRVVNQRKGGSNVTSYLYPVKSNLRKKMTNAINPIKLLYDIRTRVNPVKTDNSLKMEIVNKNEGKAIGSKKLQPYPRLDSKKRYRRSDVTIKTQGGGITLELKEFLNSVTGSLNSKDEEKPKGDDSTAEEADSTAPRVALALPKHLLMDATTQFNPPFKVNRYHCHKFNPPCARYAAVHSQRRRQRLRNGAPDYVQRPKNAQPSSELVNFLLMLHGNNSGTIKHHNYEEEQPSYEDDESYDDDENVDDDDEENDIFSPLQEVQSQRICTNCDMGPCGCRSTSSSPRLTCSSSTPTSKTSVSTLSPCHNISSSSPPCGSSTSSSPCGSSTSSSPHCRSSSPTPCPRGTSSSSVKPSYEHKIECPGGNKNRDFNIEEHEKSHFGKTECLTQTLDIPTHTPMKASENSMEIPDKGEVNKQSCNDKHNDAATAEVKCNMCNQSQSCSSSSESTETTQSVKCPKCTSPPPSTCPTKPCLNTCPTRRHSYPSTETMSSEHNQPSSNCASSTSTYTCPTPVPTQPCTTPARSTYTCPPSKCTTCPTPTFEPISQQHELVTMIAKPAVTPPEPPDCFKTATVRQGKNVHMDNGTETTTHHQNKDITEFMTGRKRVSSRRRSKLIAMYNNDLDLKNNLKLIPVRRLKQGKIRFDEAYEGKPLSFKRLVGLHSRRSKLTKDRLKAAEKGGLVRIIPSYKSGLWHYVPYKLIHVKDVEKPLEIKRGILKEHKTLSGSNFNIIGPLKSNAIEKLLERDNEETNQFQEAAFNNEEAKEDYEDDYDNYLDESDGTDNPRSRT
ncbi:hypothetical protein GE061_002284 [Apolygus lucorum]|uniref:Uncharacterized protein n=1 Tax=Apolygus lucorum TaxID=248454 RepID=A0A8S9X7A4_APOLU|nr:hypothetical protein GE061_002284 [Apolygus lucorum]